MKATPFVGKGRRAALLIAVTTLGVVLAIAPEVFAWGRRAFGGGFGGGYGEASPPAAPAYQGGGGYGAGGTGQTYIYPDKGQSPQQEQNDKAQCYTWAVQQSGFDPANPRVPSAPPPVASAPQGGAFRGAAGGAALGAVGGAIGGNAGEGAAIGAATGALFGGMRRRRWAEQQQYQQQTYLEQQQAALNQGRSNFNRAFGVCMTGRGYSVGG
jgi:Glycine-zipper domain